MSLNPNDPNALNIYTMFLLHFDGATREALDLMERIAKLAPFSPRIRKIRTEMLWVARMYEAAVEDAEQVRRLAPDFYDYGEALSLLALGRFGQSHQVFDRIHERCGTPCEWVREAAEQGWIDGGWEGRLQEVLSAARMRDDYITTSIMTMWLGDLDAAFDAYERALMERHPSMTAIATIPADDVPRVDPRFPALLRRIGLPDLSKDPGVRAGTARAMALVGRGKDALSMLNSSIQASPADMRLPRWAYCMALAHFTEEAYKEAIEWADRSLEQAPGKYTAADLHLISAASHAHLKSIDDAREALDKALTLWPDLTLDLVPLPPSTDPDLRKRYVEGLRTAGLTREGFDVLASR